MIARISLVASLAALLCLTASCSESHAASAAGTYSLDIDKTINALVQAQAKATGKELTEDQAKDAAGIMKLGVKGGTLELKADMSFSGSFDMMGKKTIKGTWTIEGDKLTFNQTHEDGKEAEDTASATMKDSLITVTFVKEGQQMQMFFNKDAK